MCISFNIGHPVAKRSTCLQWWDSRGGSTHIRLQYYIKCLSKISPFKTQTLTQHLRSISNFRYKPHPQRGKPYCDKGFVRQDGGRGDLPLHQLNTSSHTLAHWHGSFIFIFILRKRYESTGCVVYYCWQRHTLLLRFSTLSRWYMSRQGALKRILP
jgi:hypothetical protein